MVQTELSEQIVEHYGNLKIYLEKEGDGYALWGAGLPKEYENDKELVKHWQDAATQTDTLKSYIEKKIIDNGGNPEDWQG